MNINLEKQTRKTSLLNDKQEETEHYIDESFQD